MTIRRNVEYILRKNNMNKAELAEILGLHPSTVTQYLDTKNIGLVAVCKFAKALGVKPADLIASPPLSDKNQPTDATEEMARISKPINTSFVCHECGTKFKITIEED